MKGEIKLMLEIVPVKDFLLGKNFGIRE